MPRELALLLIVAAIFWMLRRNKKLFPNLSWATWLPTLWLLIVASRPVTYWLDGGVVAVEFDEVNEGSLADRIFYLILIILSTGVLISRGFNWKSVIHPNSWLMLLYAYLALSALWSEIPSVSTKRWIKEIGALSVICVLLTERYSQESIRAVCLRVAYITFPLSLLFIKYMPEIGRSYTKAGEMMVTGVGTQKNSLGQSVAVLMIFLIWDILKRRKDAKDGTLSFYSITPQAISVAVGAWLLLASDSKTSQVALIIGIVILLCPKRLVSPKRAKLLFLTFLILPPLIFSAAIIAPFIQPLMDALGRDLTFTGRTNIWAEILNLDTNPLFGVGFFIFWSTPKGQAVREIFPDIATAHNGYLELFLDGGFLALALLLLMLWHSGMRISKRIEYGDASRVCYALLLMLLFFNLSESSLFRMTPCWFVSMLTLLALVPTISKEPD